MSQPVAYMTDKQLGDLVLKGIGAKLKQQVEEKIRNEVEPLIKTMAKQCAEQVAAKVVQYRMDENPITRAVSVNVVVNFGEVK